MNKTALIFLTTKCGKIEGSTEKEIRIVTIPDTLVEQHPNYHDCTAQVNINSPTLGNTKYRCFKLDGTLSNKLYFNTYINVLINEE